MNNEQQHLEALLDIRKMMKRSSKFLSLSGLSGVFAGIFASIGAAIAHWYIATSVEKGEPIFIKDLVLIACSVLFCALLSAYVFSARRAKKEGVNLFDSAGLMMLMNLFVPLFAGGVFCVALLYAGVAGFVAPTMLVFYGLALINTSKYTYDDIRYLGLSEIGLGLVCAFNLGNGLIYWTIGFGALHILYGGVMWYKYERN